MNQSLKNFKEEYLELILQFLWRQWSALGVAGYAETGDEWIIDPDALLIFTATIARHEPRLFDEVLDWLDVNGHFINIQRLKTILKNESFRSGKVLSAIASVMARRASMLKWKRLSESYDRDDETEPLFFQKDGKPLPRVGEPDVVFKTRGLLRDKMILRGYSQPFSTEAKTSLGLKIRALLGVNARCEILMYLLTHEDGHPSEIARETYFFHRTIQDALIEMSRSGIVQSRTNRRERRYWMKTDPWRDLLGIQNDFPEWVNWPPLFSALERIWLKLSRSEFLELDPLLQSSELRQLMRDVRPDIERAGFARTLTDDRGYLGEDYTTVFLSDIMNLLG